LWDLATGEHQVFQPHSEWARGAAFTRDGDILSWSEDEVKLWDPRTGKEQVIADEGILGTATLNQPGTRILSWRWDPDDPSVQLWDAETGAPVISPLVHDQGVNGAVFNQDESRILSSSDDGTVRLWDAKTGKSLMHNPPKHGGSAGGAVFNEKETRILSWSDDGTVRLWDVETGQSAIAPLRHDEEVEGAVFNHDESRILSWDSGGTVRLWDAVTGKLAIAPRRYEKAAAGARFSDGETWILSWNEDGIWWWDISYPADVSSEDLGLRIQAQTGTRLTESGELEFLTAAEWQSVKGTTEAD
jgi:WD40 repeat protein